MRASSLPVRVPTLFPGHPTHLGSAQAGIIAVFEDLCLMFSECVYRIHSKVTYRLFLDYFVFWIFPIMIYFHAIIFPTSLTPVLRFCLCQAVSKALGRGGLQPHMQIVKKTMENAVR